MTGLEQTDSKVEWLLSAFGVFGLNFGLFPGGGLVEAGGNHSTAQIDPLHSGHSMWYGTVRLEQAVKNRSYAGSEPSNAFIQELRAARKVRFV